MKAARAFRDRMVGEAIVDARTLKDNPKNWRTHSDEQRAAMREVLESVGWVQKVVVNKRTGHILDGHLRKEEAAKRGERVPVVYVDLTPAEERRMLALFDPIGAMAGIDRKRLRSVIDDVGAETPGLAGLIASLRKTAGIAPKIEEKPEVPFTEELMEEHNYIVLYFDNPVDWLFLQSVYELPEVKSLRSEGKFQQVGIGRVVKGAEFIRKVRGEA